MTEELWEEKPKAEEFWWYDAHMMDGWLEKKVKPELDKLEAIKTFIKAKMNSNDPAYSICVGVQSILEGDA